MDTVWQIRTDHVTLLVQPGHKSLEEGDPIPVGVPYGSRARLILLYLQSEALRTQSREVELGRSMNAWLRRMGIPVGGKSIQGLANNSMALDIYCWLAYRLHSLHEPKMVTWKALHPQFGRSVARLDHFRAYFRVNLELALAVYPDARVEAEPGGLRMSPSRPPVAPKLIQISGSRTRKAP